VVSFQNSTLLIVPQVVTAVAFIDTAPLTFELLVGAVIAEVGGAVTVMGMVTVLAWPFAVAVTKAACVPTGVLIVVPITNIFVAEPPFGTLNVGVMI
jgi:hypothetical protein